MPFSPELVLALGGGLGVLLLVVGIALSAMGRRSTVSERLGRYAEGGPAATAVGEAEEKAKRASPIMDLVERVGKGTSFYESIARGLAQADLKLRPGEYIALVIGFAGLFGAAGTYFGSSYVFGLICAVIGGFLPRLYVGRARRKRLTDFDNQLGDMLNLMVNGLRAGYSTLMAMEAVGRELPSPMSDEFRRVVQEIQLGLTMEQALDHLVRRINSDDLDMVITAIEVQREVGGNLAEVIDVISETIRERVRIKGELRALTATGRFTAWVISLLPVGLMFLLYLINRPYMMQFFSPETRTCGIPLLIVAGLLIFMGFTIVQRMVRVDI